MVMYNDLIVLGPDADPAGVRDTKSAPESFAKIAEKQAIFISRGDDSGTDKKEKQLWETAGIKPAGDWYREAGQGMGKVIQMAGELEVPPLAADFRTNQDARALGLGEPGGIAIALEKTQVLMEKPGLHMDLGQQFFLHRDGGIRRAGDEQDLLIVRQ